MSLSKSDVLQVWLVVETVIIYFLYPETKGPTLEELAYCGLPPASAVRYFPLWPVQLLTKPYCSI